MKLPRIKMLKFKNILQEIFGFESINQRFLKSSKLDEIEVAAALAKLETNQNWIRRVLWLVVLGSIGEHFIG